MPPPPPPPPPPPQLEEQKYLCHCGKAFPSSTRYHKHVKLHDAMRLCRCSFPGCGKNFKRKTHLDRHVNQHKAEKPFPCIEPGCSRSFATRQKLASHANTHRGLQCSVCELKFRKRAQLEHHTASHSKERQRSATAKAKSRTYLRHLPAKQHKCEKCEECFPLRSDLVAHQRAQHPKQFPCHECGKTYRSPSALRSHVSHIHLEIVVPCTVPGCGLTFSSTVALSQHRRVVHLGLRPFSCVKCGQTFAYKAILRRHCQVHHAEDERTVSTRVVDASKPANDLDGAGAEADGKEGKEDKRQKQAFKSSGQRKRKQPQLLDIEEMIHPLTSRRQRSLQHAADGVKSSKTSKTSQKGQRAAFVEPLRPSVALMEASFSSHA